MKINFKTGFKDGPFIEITGDSDIPIIVRFINIDTKQVVYEELTTTNTWHECSVKYYFNCEIQVVKLSREIIYTHVLNLEDKDVFICFESSSLGDTIAWMPYVEEFRKAHKCHVFVKCWFQELFDYPQIYFVNDKEDYYARYTLGIFNEHGYHPNHTNTIPLQKVASDILGFNYTCLKPVMDELPIVNIKKRKKKYVCISIQSTAQCKYWNNKSGWYKTVEGLKNRGYDVVCIDKHFGFGVGDEMNECPSNCIDDTGDKPLENRMNTIKGCEFFIGISSGLSWLAWACDKPVIMISGFTDTWNEFDNEYRVINKNVCNSCWNKKENKFDRDNWLWCPEGKGFECSKEISVEMVEEQIKRIESNEL